MNVSGPVDEEHAILLGSLVAFAGRGSEVSRARQRSMEMAVEEIDALGGIPGATPEAPPRPIVMVSCDETADALRAAHHLVEDLHVSALIGPTASQTTLDLTMQLTIGAGTLNISPTALAASIAELRDDDLSWQMVPSDEQRGALLLHQLRQLEDALRAERDHELRLSMIFQNDSLGDGTRAALGELSWNGKALSDPENLGGNIKLSNYEPGAASYGDLVDAHLAFAPDVVILVGGNSIVDDVVAPLEAAWERGPRPQYLLTDSSKGPALLNLAALNAELATRVRGTGVRPSPESERVRRGAAVLHRRPATLPMPRRHQLRRRRSSRVRLSARLRPRTTML